MFHLPRWLVFTPTTFNHRNSPYKNGCCSVYYSNDDSKLEQTNPKLSAWLDTTRKVIKCSHLNLVVKFYFESWLLNSLNYCHLHALTGWTSLKIWRKSQMYFFIFNAILCNFLSACFLPFQTVKLLDRIIKVDNLDGGFPRGCFELGKTVFWGWNNLQDQLHLEHRLHTKHHTQNV